MPLDSVVTKKVYLWHAWDWREVLKYLCTLNCLCCCLIVDVICCSNSETVVEAEKAEEAEIELTELADKAVSLLVGEGRLLKSSSGRSENLKSSSRRLHGQITQIQSPLIKQWK